MCLMYAYYMRGGALKSIIETRELNCDVFIFRLARLTKCGADLA